VYIGTVTKRVPAIRSELQRGGMAVGRSLRERTPDHRVNLAGEFATERRYIGVAMLLIYCQEVGLVTALGAAKLIAVGAAKLIAPIGPTSRRWGRRGRPN
jgi:hypothetical protein